MKKKTETSQGEVAVCVPQNAVNRNYSETIQPVET